MKKSQENLVLRVVKHFEEDMHDVGIFTYQRGFRFPIDFSLSINASNKFLDSKGKSYIGSELGNVDLTFRFIEDGKNLEIYIPIMIISNLSKLTRKEINKKRLLVEAEYWASNHGNQFYEDDALKIYHIKKGLRRR